MKKWNETEWRWSYVIFNQMSNLYEMKQSGADHMLSLTKCQIYSDSLGLGVANSRGSWVQSRGSWVAGRPTKTRRV